MSERTHFSNKYIKPITEESAIKDIKLYEKTLRLKFYKTI